MNSASSQRARVRMAANSSDEEEDVVTFGDEFVIRGGSSPHDGQGGLLYVAGRPRATPTHALAGRLHREGAAAARDSL